MNESTEQVRIVAVTVPDRNLVLADPSHVNMVEALLQQELASGQIIEAFHVQGETMDGRRFEVKAKSGALSPSLLQALAHGHLGPAIEMLPPKLRDQLSGKDRA